MKFSLLSTAVLVPGFIVEPTSAEHPVFGLRGLEGAQVETAMSMAGIESKPNSEDVPEDVPEESNTQNVKPGHGSGSSTCNEACFDAVPSIGCPSEYEYFHGVHYGCNDDVTPNGLCISNGECGTNSREYNCGVGSKHIEKPTSVFRRIACPTTEWLGDLATENQCSQQESRTSTECSGTDGYLVKCFSYTDLPVGSFAITQVKFWLNQVDMETAQINIGFFDGTATAGNPSSGPISGPTPTLTQTLAGPPSYLPEAEYQIGENTITLDTPFIPTSSSFCIGPGLPISGSALDLTLYGESGTTTTSHQGGACTAPRIMSWFQQTGINFCIEAFVTSI